MIDKQMIEELSNAQFEFVENLIFECALDAGFRTDGENFFVGRHSEIDVTENLWEFTALIAGKLKLYQSKPSSIQ